MNEELYDLTNPQKSIWLTEQFYKGSAINTICGTVHIDKKIDFEKLNIAINTFLRDNDAFRIRLLIDESGNVKQYFTKYVPIQFSIEEILNNDELMALESQMATSIFDVIGHDLYNIKLFKFPNGKGGFIVSACHLVVDAHTASLIASKVINIYSALIKNEAPAESSTSYVDYINSEKEYLNGSKFEKDKEYWEEQFKIAPEFGVIPSLRESTTESCVGARELFNIPADTVERINTFCKNNKISMFNFLMAVYAIYIGRISNLDEFVIGTPILNRTTFAEKNTPGMFISTVPLKFTMSNSTSFIEFVQKIGLDSLGMLRHQKYPYQKILEHIRESSPDQPNLYDILISYQNSKTNNTSSDVPYIVSWTFNNNVADSMQIHLFDMNDEGKLNVAYDYRVNKYSPDDINSIHNRVCYIIEQILSKNGIMLDDIDIVTPSEKDLLLNKFNNTLLTYDNNKTIIDYFEEQVQKKPDRIALVFENTSLTYKELNCKVNSLAYYLRSIGVKNDTIIGVMVNRSLELIISILAVLKSGGAYIPIDPEYPQERISYMLENSNSNIVISSRALQEKANNFRIENVVISDLDNTEIYNLPNTNLNKITTPEDISYLIYTSGSTGMPKGVTLTHKNISNFIASMFNKIDYLKDNKPHSIVSITTVSFDIFAFETLISLCGGLKLFMTNDVEQKITTKLEHLILNNNIEIIQSTPSVMAFHLENSTLNGFSSLKYVMLAGEQLPINLVKNIKKICPDCTIYNGYGPSETTIFSAVNNVTNSDFITIGKPINNTSFYILDKNLNFLPPNTIGEIYISGDGVGAGYLNREDLTCKSYLPDPFVSGHTMYKSGDLGLWLSNGEVLCKGRIDHQIKLRGLRIELGEIEEKISSFNTSLKIKCAVIVKTVHKAIGLHAFFSSSESINIDDLQKYLIANLPNYMVPLSFTRVDSLPFTPNGKIDRKALQAYQITPVKSVKRRATTITPTENKLINIISNLAHIKKINVEDSFFTIGLDSLLIINLATILSKEYSREITIKDIYTAQNVKTLANFIDTTNYKTLGTPISKAPVSDFYPLSSAQKRIYYACQLIKDSLLYNVSGAILVNSTLEKDKIEKAFNILIKLHDCFRTSFITKDGIPYQRVENDVKLNIEFSKSDFSDRDKILNSFSRSFDLSVAPLLRICVHYFDNGSTLLLLDTHHIVVDGSSLNILIEDFFNLYNGSNVEKSNISYTDYSVWENNYINSDKINTARDYWTKNFENYTFPILNLPYDFPQSNAQSFEGNSIDIHMNNNLFKNIIRLANKNEVSLYVVFLTALYILLYKYTGQNDFIIGSPIEGRNLAELKHIIGMFVNNIVLKQHIEESQTITELLYNVHKVVFEALDNQPYPYNLIANNVNNNSLLDVVLTYQNAKSFYDYGSLHADVLHVNNKTSKFKLLFEVVPDTQTIRLEYNTSLFKQATAQNILEHYLYILEQLVLPSTDYIYKIETLTEKEEKLLDKFNSTDGIINNDTAISLFERQATLNPNNIALFCDGKSLTYKELNDKANSLAHYLIKRGIRSNDIVCIMTNRSFETIVCMLGILKAGAAFFNVDPTYPMDRTKYYLENSNTHYILVQRCLKDKIKNIENAIEIDLDLTSIYGETFDNPNVTVAPNDLSYLIYTSGSTGLPKGVMLTQVGLANMCKAMTLCLDYLKEGNKHTLLSVTSTPFDIFVYEIIVSLTHGLRVVMANNAEHRNPKLVDSLIHKYNVDVMTVTPSLMKINYDNREPNTALANVKNMVFGGEPLPEKFVADLRELSDDITIYNIYGPSEITVLSNVQNLNNEKEITVGPPILNTQIHILDSNMNRVPIGVVGEIYISGIQVGQGYMGKPDLTAEKFLDNPFGPGKIYKSGDLGRWTFDGKVQCLGRIDHQIKLRGLRIELGEIENKLSNISGVTSCVVNKIEINNKEVLCGYYVSEKELDESEIRATLRKDLPPYMMPTYFVHLDAMPYTLNRKIDRKALPLPILNKPNATSKVNISELSSNEEKLLQIWKNILRLDKIELTDNFFDIGGDSLSAINLQLEAIKYGLDFEYADIFNYPTISQLSKKIPSTESSFIDNYDYSSVNEILNKNIEENLSSIVPCNVNSILLVGSTGYLGAHIIDSIMKNTNVTVYCLIRKKAEHSPIERIKDTLNFYFEDKYNSLLGTRIKVVQGDITAENLGMSFEDYDNTFNNIDLVLNSGALVKHFGAKNEFENINVTGTKNIVDACMKKNKRLIHISTISVSGNGEKEETIVETPDNINNKIIFKEDNLYIGQNLKGIYAITKYKAELLILNAIKDGLDVQILRIGNITNRYSDGAFQRNVDDNAFAKRFKSFVQIGAIPSYLLKHAIELTPVDLCADAITKIMMYNSKCNVLHLYNPNLLNISLMYSTLTDMNIDITPVSDKLMTYIITGILNTDTSNTILSGIVQDLNNEKKLVYTSRIRLNSDFTLAYLNKIGFTWKKLDEKYIQKYINYFKKIKFID